jgi:PAS domain S-box-containing protein
MPFLDRNLEPAIRFQTFLDSAPDAMVVVDQHGRIAFVNVLATRLFHYAADDLLGHHVEMLMPAALRDSEVDKSDVSSATSSADGIRTNQELLGLRKDGIELPLEVSINLLETSHGVFIPIAVRDVSHLKSTGFRLHQTNQQLRFILDSMPQTVATTDPDGEVTYYNPQITEYTGLSFEQISGSGWTQFVHPEDVEEHLRQWKQCIANGHKFEFASRFRRFDGAYRWHFSRALPMRDAAGSIVMWVGSNTDIHDIKEAKAALQITEVRYRRLFEAAKDGILILDFITGRIIDSNPFMSDLLGYQHEAFLGKELWEIGLFKDRAANEAAVRTLQESGYLRYEHLPLESQAGSTVEVEIVANAYREGDHQVIQCNIRDITERSRLEKLLQSQATELANLHLRKDEFLAMLSHELRSPLAPIANAVQLLSLQQDAETRIQQQARNIIERQVGKLQHLVDDLLEVSRITSGRVQLRREWVAVNGIADGAVETVRPLMEQRRHELSVTLPIEPVWLHADASRLEQVLVNLLTNSAKYTEEGGRVWLNVQKERDECVIRVRDSGVGIAPTLLPHVFDLFTQAERSLDRSQGGLGIGLALVQRLTELHGGTVEASSKPGKGSEFIVRLPLLPDDKSHTADIAITTDKARRTLRVLVVDDNEDTVMGYSMLMKAYGHEARTAKNGISAIQQAKDFQPHVVMLDIGLPGMNGYEVARKIRQQPQGNDIVLIAMTGYGQDSDRQTSAEAGFNHHLVKPAKFDQLLQILNEVEARVL